MLLGNPPGQEEPVAASLVLRGKTRLENFADLGLTQPRSLVGNPHLELTVRNFGLEHSPALALHGFDCIAQQNDKGFGQGGAGNRHPWRARVGLNPPVHPGMGTGNLVHRPLHGGQNPGVLLGRARRDE